jgi:hypothetical protein
MTPENCNGEGSFLGITILSPLPPVGTAGAGGDDSTGGAGFF